MFGIFGMGMSVSEAFIEYSGRAYYLVTLACFDLKVERN